MGEMLQTVLRAMAKSRNRLKGTKAFAHEFPGRNIKFFSKFAREERMLGSFYCKAAACNVL